jgi:hypothetical protein
MAAELPGFAGHSAAFLARKKRAVADDVRDLRASWHRSSVAATVHRSRAPSVSLRLLEEINRAKPLRTVAFAANRAGAPLPRLPLS